LDERREVEVVVLDPLGLVVTERDVLARCHITQYKNT
jgi:hypothetical protein